jgi:hypothetical protein
MAKAKRNQKTVETESAPVADSQTNTVETPTTDNQTEQKTDTNIMEFKKVSTHKNGLTSYSVVGLRGSIYVGAGVFGKGVEPPDTIEVNSPLLVQPTAEQIERANKRAERKTRVRATLSERLAKAEEKAKKAAERAAKLKERADKEAAKNAPAPAAAEAFPADSTAATE